MLDTVANAAISVKDDKRLALLREQGTALIEQARIALSGPDLDYLEKNYEDFERRFSS